MSQALAIPNYNHQPDRLAFFQQMVLNGLTYWQEHAALESMDIPILDKERESILSALNRGLEFDQAWPLALTLIDKLAAYMERRGYWTAWRSVLEKAVATSQRVGDIQGETTMTALLARLSQRQGRGQDVVRNYRRAMKLAKQSNNHYEYARSCCNLGYYYIDAGRWWRSEVLSLRALEIFHDLRSEHGLAHAHNHLGVLNLRQERWDEARSNLEAASVLWQRNKDKHNLLYAYMNFGLLHMEQEEPQQALDYLKEAYQIASQIDETSNIPTIWANMAAAYRQQLNWEKAEAYALNAEKSYKDYRNEQGLANIWQTLGVISLHIGRDRAAIHYLSKSLAMQRKLKNSFAATALLKTIESLADLSGDINTARSLRNLISDV